MINSLVSQDISVNQHQHPELKSQGSEEGGRWNNVGGGMIINNYIAVDTEGNIRN